MQHWDGANRWNSLSWKTRTCLTYIVSHSLHRISSHGIDHLHDDVIKWIHFMRYWPFMRGIHWSPVNSPRKGQWRGALMYSMICVWINGWVNNREAGDLRRYRTHYDVTVMSPKYWGFSTKIVKKVKQYFVANVGQLATTLWADLNAV